MDAVQQILKNLGLVRLALMAALLVGIGSGVYYLVQRFNKPDMALLYGDVDLADAGKIVGKIESMNVQVELRGGGSQIYVPADKVARMRIELAEIGLPKSGTLGYEIFDKNDSLGVSSFVQGIQHLRALEGEIARTISSMAQVTSARVHLVLPKRKLFSRESDEPSAAVMLSLAGAGRLSTQKIQAIQQLVAAAVPALSSERVSIVDDKGNLLARGDGDSSFYSAAQLDERKLSYENRLSQTIENLVFKYVGEGKARAEVAVEMDFDRSTENNETYDPEGQVIRSTQTIKSSDDSTEPGGQSASVENKLPNAGANTAGANGTTKSNKSEETVNYEISKKIKTHVKETGGIKRISVALMVDGILKPGENGKEPTYQPRPEEEMKKLTTLVQSAIGYNKERGDVVEVINMRFAPLDMGDMIPVSDPFFGFSKHDVVRMAESLIIGLIGLLILLLVIKPLSLRLMDGMKIATESSPSALENQALMHASPAALMAPQGMAGEGIGSLQNAAGQAGQTGGGHDTEKEATALEQMISMKQVEGQLRASSIKTVGDIIDNNPDDAVNVVRSWMAEKGRK